MRSRALAAGLCMTLLFATTAARGDEPPPAAMDFNLLPGPTAPDAGEAARLARIDRDVRRRRVLLTAHQIAGFSTLVLLAATLVLGQLNYLDKYGGGGDTGVFYGVHAGLAGTATFAFAITGTLALLAPNPYPKPLRFDAALVHKLAMALAAVGMLTEVVLGPITASREGHLDQRGWAAAHLVTGYATFAFMGVGTLAFVF